jgi:hypothetical protein
MAVDLVAQSKNVSSVPLILSQPSHLYNLPILLLMPLKILIVLNCVNLNATIEHNFQFLRSHTSDILGSSTGKK